MPSVQSELGPAGIATDIQLSRVVCDLAALEHDFHRNGASEHSSVATTPYRSRRAHNVRHARSIALDASPCVEIRLKLGSIDDAVVTIDERIDQLGAASLPKC
jgi:hypothetical protein